MLPTAMSMVNEAVPYLYPGAKDIFMTAKVRDILFDGILIHCTDPAVDFICGAMKGTLPKTIQVAPNGKDFIFSMFRHVRNKITMYNVLKMKKKNIYFYFLS